MKKLSSAIASAIVTAIVFLLIALGVNAIIFNLFPPENNIISSILVLPVFAISLIFAILFAPLILSIPLKKSKNFWLILRRNFAMTLNGFIWVIVFAATIFVAFTMLDKLPKASLYEEEKTFYESIDPEAIYNCHPYFVDIKQPYGAPIKYFGAECSFKLPIETDIKVFYESSTLDEEARVTSLMSREAVGIGETILIDGRELENNSFCLSPSAISKCAPLAAGEHRVAIVHKYHWLDPSVGKKQFQIDKLEIQHRVEFERGYENSTLAKLDEPYLAIEP